MIVLENSNGKMLKSKNYVALGSFDGFHLGHMSLLSKAKKLALEENGESMILTFSNHPLTLINPKKAPNILMTNKEKKEFLINNNIDILILEEFNEKFMKQSPEDFIEYIVEKYNIKGIVVGFNFKFGYKNLGDTELLEKLQSKYNYKLSIEKAFNYRDSTISSSRIRKEIKEGDITEANKMLGRNYQVSGSVIHGKKLGRTIGFPTANIEFNKEKVIPKGGVYYTNVVYNGQTYKGITNIGYNPTVNGNKLSIETFIIDFDKEIYGEEIKVEFIEKIREEKKFDSIKDLIKQLDKDKNYAMNKL